MKLYLIWAILATIAWLFGINIIIHISGFHWYEPQFWFIMISSVTLQIVVLFGGGYIIELATADNSG